MSWRVLNKIDKCFDGKVVSRNITKISCMIIHRIGSSLGSNAEEIAEAFRDTSNEWSAGSYTGGQVPYTFLVLPDGTVEQMLAISDTGWHARRWSKPGIGIACLGDFRTEHPTMEMWESLVTLCSTLSFWLGVCEIFGHTELPFASRDPDKECPGKKLSMDRLRADVFSRVKSTSPNLTLIGKDLVLKDYKIIL